MTNRVDLTLERTTRLVCETSFSTNHDTDLVEKWLNTREPMHWDGEFDENLWDEDGNGDYPTLDYAEVNEGGGDDEDCDYDDQIQEWIDENTVDMNQIFSSGCEVQKITDFIKKNEKLFNTLTKKKLVEELTEDEKEVFYELREIAGLRIPYEYGKEYLTRRKQNEK